MRKLVLWLMLFALVIVPCSAGAVESVPVEFNRVGMFKVFSANGTVVIESGDSESRIADYSAVTSYDYSSAFLGASIKGSYKEGDTLPSGTLTTPSRRYSLSGRIGSGNLIVYGSYYYYYLDTNTKARWSLNSSPASVGSTIIPPYEYFRYDYQEIPEMDSIVPYVELEHSDSGYKITGVKVHFVESGDTKPVSTPDVSAVRIRVGDRLEGFTDFNGDQPVICTMSADQTDTESFYVYVAYDRGDNTYSWTFWHPSHRDKYNSGYTVWQRYTGSSWSSFSTSYSLALSTASPDTMISYSSSDIKITLSGDAVFKDFLTVNDEIISLDYEMSKDIYSNDVILAHVSAKNPGYTTLRLKYSLYDSDYTQMRTVSVQTPNNYRAYYYSYYSYGYNGAIEEWTDESSLSPYIKAVSYDVSVNYVEGRPFYETLNSSCNASVGLTCSDDSSFADAKGTVFIGSGYSNRYSLRYDGEGKFSLIGSYGNEESFSSSSSFFSSSYTKWVEAPGYDELNGVVSFSDDIKDTFKTTDDILSGDFMPYAEIVFDGNSPKTIKWSLINSKTKEKLSSLPAGLEDLHVWHDSNSSGMALAESSGEFDISGYSYYSYPSVYVSYRLNGEYYRWRFIHASANYSIISDAGRLAENPLRISEDEYLDVSFDLSRYYGSYYIRVEAGSTDIVSVDLVSFDMNNVSQSIRIYGKKEGQTTISFIFYRRNSTGNWYSYYRSEPYLIYVGGYESETPEVVEPEVMYLDITHSYSSSAALIEGKPFYYDRDDNSNMSVTLRKTDYLTLSRALFDSREERTQLLQGVLSITNPSGQVSSQDITLDYSAYYYNYYNNYYNSVDIYPYYSIGELPSGTVVSWNFPSLDISGEETVEYPHVRTSLEQYNTYMPHVELVTDGLYITGIKWCFVDSHDNPVQVSGITNISIRSWYNIDPSGDITFASSVPVSNYDGSTIDFNFTENGIRYDWSFRISNYYYYSNGQWSVSSDFPVVMNVSDTKNITVNVYGRSADLDLMTRTGSSILSVDIVGISDFYNMYDSYRTNVELRLTAKEAGVTTLTLFDSNNGGYSQYGIREVWICDSNDKVPGISDTDTASTLIDRIAEGYGVSYDIPDAPVVSPDEPSPVEPVRIWRYLYDGETVIENEPRIWFTGDNYELNYLSIRPRFAVPQYVSGDVKDAAYEYADTLELGESEGAFDLEDMNLAASRDVLTVFDAVKFSLISKDIPQLLAIVLPAVSIDEAGVYVFSVSTDNIPYGKKIFWYSDQASVLGASSDEQIFMNSSGISIDTTSYYSDTVNVAVYLEEGYYEPVIAAQATSDDVNLIKGIRPPEPVTVRITTSYLEDGAVGVPYSAEFTATHSTDVTWAMTSGVLPSGLAFSSKGIISGTPSSAGTFSFGIRASYQDVYDQESFSLVITGTDSPDARPSSGDIPQATAGSLYTYILITTITDATWSLAEDSRLPEGLVLDSATGQITGTPAEPGTYTFTVTASDGKASETRTIVIVILGITPGSPDIPAPTSPDVSPDVRPSSLDVSPASPDVKPYSGDVPQATAGTLYTYVLITNITNATWTLAGDSKLPEGLVLDSATGQITGTPAEPGTYTFTVTASNGETSETRTIVIVIAGSSNTPASSDVSPDVKPDSSDINPSSPDVSPDNNGGSGNGTAEGDNTVTITPISAVPEAPKVSIQEVAETIIGILRSISQALMSIITENTTVTELPENASGSERTVDDMSDEDLASIPDTQTPAAVLPIITVTEPAVYVFGVTLNNLEAGAFIFLHLMAEPASGARPRAFYSAADEEEAYTFLDDNGKETKVVPANKHINVAAYMTPENTYAPVITTEAPGKSDGSGPGDSSGGGCSTGFSVYALFLLGLCVKAKGKK